MDLKTDENSKYHKQTAKAELQPYRSQEVSAGENSAEREKERGADSKGAEEDQRHDIPAPARVKGHRIH